MFAIVDVSRRASRGKILLLVDDHPTASEIAGELNRLTVAVTVQRINPQQFEQVKADAREGTSPRAEALA
jgi:hypothetical protein